jgi:hypothetical protein
MKIYDQGKLVRTREGRFTSFKSFVRKVWFWTKVSMAAVALVGFGFVISASNKVEAINNVTVIDKMPEKIEALQNEVLDTISACEAPGYKDGDAPIILDTNAKMSIGPFMFQVATVQHYEKELIGRDVSRLEATTIALDEKQARELAKAIVFKANGLGNWLNCANKWNLRPKVDVIRELQK